MSTFSGFRHVMSSPLGNIEICALPIGITSIYFVDADVTNDHKHPLTELAESQLQEYFSGTRMEFDLPTAANGTHFQKQVWQALTQIPFGETRSYSDIALALNNPKAVRAIGAANGKNPLSIIVPCHRVIGANGTLTGYAGGIERKKKLLVLENANRQGEWDI